MTKFKESTYGEGKFVSSDSLSYDVLERYIKPEDIVECPIEAKRLSDAISLVSDFISAIDEHPNFQEF